MSKMVSVASGFQYSVNIGYDLNNDDKLKNFIPTKSAMTLLKDILCSTAPDATERARVLVGAYGKGKSHIILTILSMLMQRDQSLFTHLMPKIKEDPELEQLVNNYYSDNRNRILPVIINGTSSSLPQAFLLAVRIALQRAETYDCEIADTLQEACIGLIMAVDRYDPDSNGPFGSYASLWILQNIGRAQATQRPVVYYPVHKKEGYFTMYPILKNKGYLNSDIWTDEDARMLIQDRLGCSIDQVEDIINQSMPIESFDAIYEMFLNRIEMDKLQDDVFENITEGEIQENVFRNINVDAFYWTNDVYDIERMALREGLENLMGGLKNREQEVLKMRYGFDDGVEKTLEEVGQMFGVTRERIRQIESKAIKKLLQSRRKRKLKDFL